MRYRKHDPGEVLSPYVECLYVWDHDEKLVEPFITETPPNGFTALVFNLGDPYQILSSNKNWEKVPICFISGQNTKTYSFKIQGSLEMIGIVFKPASLHDLFGIEMEGIVNRRVDARLIPALEADSLYQQLKSVKTLSERYDLITHYLHQHLKAKTPIWDEVNDALDQINHHNGILSLKDIYAKYELSTRQFQRNFRRKVGLTPKHYVRLRRFSYICYLLLNQKKIDWQEVIYLGGYYDQSHFIKDFLNYMEENPSQYYATHQELNQFLQ